MTGLLRLRVALGLRARHAADRIEVGRATLARAASARGGSDRGEGVISAAIAVLIIAMLGAAMWVVFSGMMEGATGRIESSVESIG